LQKNTKTPILEVHGHSKSSMFTPIKSLSLLLVSASATVFTCTSQYR